MSMCKGIGNRKERLQVGYDDEKETLTNNSTRKGARFNIRKRGSTRLRMERQMRGELVLLWPKVVQGSGNKQDI